MNHYIYCKKNNIDFKIDSNEWLFKFMNGWTDYFNDVHLFFKNNNYKDDEVKYLKHCDVIKDYNIKEYKNIISDLYLYNEKTLKKINEMKTKLNLEKNNYDSIFIRRGDKLVGESMYINAVEYLKILLKKNSNVKKIFLQTDDYNCYLELIEYIVNNNLNIQLLTLCEEHLRGGFIILTYYKNRILSNDVDIENTNYLNSYNQITNKSVDMMNNVEIYEHTMNMIIGIDIVLNSNICITEYSSNVARFIKLAHNNSNNVFNICDLNNEIDYNKCICPAYGF
jgi:hypothetical protein